LELTMELMRCNRETWLGNDSIRGKDATVIVG
jgi:hypothetical protein